MATDSLEGVGWKGKVSTIEELGRGDVGNSSRGGANTEEDPREMMKPVVAVQALRASLRQRWKRSTNPFD